MEKYYIMVNGEQQGPFTAQEIINKGFSNDSYIFNKGLGDWKKISEVSDFSSFEKKNEIKPQTISNPSPISDTNEIKVSENKGMKRGFWTGFLAFVIAKIIHFGACYILGILLVLAFGYTKSVRNIAEMIDNPIVGILVLIFLTRYIYFKLIKKIK